MEMGIKLVYVFDGAPPPFKKKEVERRRLERERARLALEIAKDFEREEFLKTYSEGAVSLDREKVEEAQALLRAMGVPVVVAPSEGEAQAAHLTRINQADAVGSQDYDSLLFGAKVLVRNLSLSRKRKLPGRSKWVTVEPERIELEEVLSTHGLTREQLVYLAVLVGTDFNDGVKGVGPKKGLSIVKRFSRWDDIVAFVERKYGHTFPPHVDEIIEFFLHPPVKDVVVSWGDLDKEAVMRLLVDEHDFNAERVEKVCDKLLAADAERKAQRTLDRWF